MVWIEASIEVDEHRHAGRLDRSHTSIGTLKVKIDRLLAEHRLLRLDGTDDQVRMRVGG